MTMIIKNPVGLPHEGIEEFVVAFISDNYEVVTLQPDADNTPESLIAGYNQQATYAMMMNDPGAHNSFYAIKYHTAAYGEALVPIGLFGVSDKYKVRFPLVLNGAWQGFVMFNKESFLRICDIADPEEQDIFFMKFLDVKRKFIEKVFSYYRHLNSGYTSAMAWEARGEKSSTRKIANGLGFGRMDNGKMEIYHAAEDTPASTWQYLRNCVFRWGALIDGRLQASSNVEYPVENLQHMIRCMVGYQVPVKDEV